MRQNNLYTEPPALNRNLDGRKETIRDLLEMIQQFPERRETLQKDIERLRREMGEFSKGAKIIQQSLF